LAGIGYLASVGWSPAAVGGTGGGVGGVTAEIGAFAGTAFPGANGGGVLGSSTNINIIMDGKMMR
jgi:hypothetical protein